jgi:hypothetical protein
MGWGTGGSSREGFLDSGQLLSDEQLARAYARWCERKPGECLRLLGDGSSLGVEGRRTLALSIALDSVWDETAEALDAMVDPAAVQATIVSAMAVYLTLWVLPEPVSKGVAATLTLFMAAYLGFDTVWTLIQGWRQLTLAVDGAASFDELRAAGEHFGEVLGANAARVFVLLTTAALGSTAGLMAKGPSLPGYVQAARLMETQGGFRLAAAAEVQSVAVSAQGSFSLAVAPGAMAMASRESGSSSGRPAPSSEAWRRPRFTEDGRILPYKDTRRPPNPIENKGKDRAGQVITDGKVAIRFDDRGFPVFNARFETFLDDLHIGSGRAPAHFRAANKTLFEAIQRKPGLARELGLSRADVDLLAKSDRAPVGYVWHHHQDVGRMQLVRLNEHRLSIPHTGEMAIWGGGY